MSRATKVLNGVFWPALLGLVFTSLAINVYGRFVYEEQASIFYSPAMDATCLTTTVRGQPVIWCEPGDQRPADEVFP